MLNPELASPVEARSSWRALSSTPEANASTTPGAGDLERCRTQLPIDAHVGNRAGLQMQVRTLDLVQIRQELFQLGHLAYIGSRCPELQPKSASSALTRAAAAMASRPGPPLVTGSGTRRSPSRAATHAADDEASASRS